MRCGPFSVCLWLLGNGNGKSLTRKAWLWIAEYRTMGKCIISLNISTETIKTHLERLNTNHWWCINPKSYMSQNTVWFTFGCTVEPVETCNMFTLWEYLSVIRILSIASGDPRPPPPPPPRWRKMKSPVLIPLGVSRWTRLSRSDIHHLLKTSLRENDRESTEHRAHFKSFNADTHLSLFSGQDRGDGPAPHYGFLPLERGCSLRTTVWVVSLGGFPEAFLKKDCDVSRSECLGCSCINYRMDKKWMHAKQAWKSACLVTCL